MNQTQGLSAGEALERLRQGNLRYLQTETNPGDVSPVSRLRTAKEGQQPYAIILCCSDSRVVPEHIFSAGLGELFVIRVAGNVIDDHQLGSIEYAAGHLNARLILVLGHTGCGAVDAAIAGGADGYIRYITDEILLAIGTEKDDYRACCRNVRHSMEQILESPVIHGLERERHLQIAGAMYHTDSGLVEFLETGE